ncbi:MAG: mechanosensitive ion channel family protein, partial [Limisphaerales bacterium]
IGGWFALVWLVHRWAGRCSTNHNLGMHVRPLAAPVCFLLLSRAVNYVTGSQIQITGTATTSVEFVVFAATFVALAWLIWQGALFIAEFIISSPRIPDQSLDAHLLRLVARVLGLVGLVGVLFYGGNQLGLPIYGLIAGVSVGGLAIALATQATLENFIGSINLFADRPVSVGEVCRYGEMLGTVEEIGLRSTRLRGPDRTLTTVPNAEFSKTKIVNLSRRDRMLLKTTLGLRYETTPEQLRFLLTKLRELLIAHPRVLEEGARVRFVGYGGSSLDVELFAYVATRDHAEYLAIQEDVFLRVMDLVTEAGTGFAFPSQTLYLGRDSGLDAQAGEAAHAQVQTWRREQKLPFPNPEPERVQALRDTLDWPPAGSPGAKSPTTGKNPSSNSASKRE